MLSGLLTVFMGASLSPRVRMWAGVSGLSAEPFWAITLLINNQYIMLPLVPVFAVGYWAMIINNRRIL